ncbi:acyltransferase family protein [Carnobacterium antarcticum]|uniref:Acyltransferase family protein n=1 Tax=Carnobacterium antarcticum TaxID=2126436 RepID=A0ABW4NLV2_9LACT|nr:acyltransferase [Carnobacterium sp. CP1]ALV21072.1 hypothetical protein NY10_452 [Carnobacterium sp. CP1]
MVNNSSQITERNYIYSLKGLAIISIVSAHCATVFRDTNQLNVQFSWILEQIGSVGVGIFFIISGYLFYRNKYTIKTYFKRKVNTILIPWIVTGTVVYLYIVLRKGGIEFGGWVDFILGNGSYLYYLTLLVFFYLLFFYTSKNNAFVISTIAVSCLSILITATGFIDGINNFLNPLNFIGYFSVGLIIASNNSLMKLGYRCSKYKFFLLFMYVALLIFIKLFDITSGYWGYATLILQPIAISLVFGLATMKFMNTKVFLNIGLESFSIYLLHMPVAGLVTSIFNRYDLWALTLARPLIIVGITLSCIFLYKYIGSKFKVDTYSNLIIGTRLV